MIEEQTDSWQLLTDQAIPWKFLPVPADRQHVLPSEVTTVQPPDESAVQGCFMLWIDGVGAYLLCVDRQVTIGGPMPDERAADIPLLANLSHRHATLVRNRESYMLLAHSLVKVAGRMVHEATYLNDGYEIELGSGVRLRFRLPTVLSASAVLEFLSDHRPAHSVDGVVLMDETCLLGPGAENHVRCPDWSESVLLFRKDGQFCCQSRSELFVDNRLVRKGGPIAPGDVVSGSDFRFRIEALA